MLNHVRDAEGLQASRPFQALRPSYALIRSCLCYRQLIKLPAQPPSEQASWKATPQPTAPSPLPPTPTDSFHHSPLPQYPPNSRRYTSTPAPSAWQAAPALPLTSPQSHSYSRGGSIHLPSPVMSQGRGNGREFLLSDLAEIAIQHGQRTEREGRERSTATLPTFRSLPSPVKNSWRRSDEAASRSASSSGTIAGTAMSSRTASAEVSLSPRAYR